VVEVVVELGVLEERSVEAKLVEEDWDNSVQYLHHCQPVLLRHRVTAAAACYLQ
jgi:hypothetical protein